MNSIYKTTRILTTLVVSLLLLPIQSVLADHEIISTQEGGFGCQTATFEGVAHGSFFHPENGGLIPGSVFRFGSNWLVLNGGAYENNPSGVSVAKFNLPLPAEVLFEEPVRDVTMFYAAFFASATLSAYDAGGALIDSDSGPGNAPPADTWDLLTVSSGGPNIERIAIAGSVFGNDVLIDDLKACGLLTPDVQINNLVADVVSLNLQKGISNSIDSKLNTALQALDDTNQNNDVAAVNALQAFINSVNAQRGNQISDDDANTMIAAAQAIISQLGT